MVGVLLAFGYGGRASAQTCRGLTATIVGTNQGETIEGTPRRDIIHAHWDNDTVYGLEGNDVLCTSRGDDTAYGGYGDLPVSAPPHYSIA